MSTNTDFTYTTAKLSQLDHQILLCLRDGRQSIANIRAILPPETASTSTLKRRMQGLRDRGYAEKIGPAQKSKLYGITPAGVVAGQHMHRYSQSYDDLFHDLVARTLNAQSFQYLHEIDSLFVILSKHELDVFTIVEEVVAGKGSTTAKDFHEFYSDEYTIPTSDVMETARCLYALYFFGVCDRENDWDVYRLSSLGRVATDVSNDQLLNGVSLRDYF